MVDEIVNIEVREDGSRVVESNFNKMADASERAGNVNDALAKIMKQVSTSMNNVDATLNKLNATLEKQTSTTTQAARAAEQAATAQQAQAAAAKQLSESEADATARIKAMVTASLAQQRAAFDAATATDRAASASQRVAQASQDAAQANQRAAASYTASAGAAVRQAMQVEALEDALNGGVKTIDQWRNLEGQLVDAQMRGVITGQQYQRMVKQLDGLLPSLNASIEKEHRALNSLTSQYDPLSAKMKKLESDEKLLNDLRNKGIVSLTQYKMLLAGISSQKALIGDGIEDSTKKVEKFSLTSHGASREYGVLIGELARGNWNALSGSVLTLSNRLGVLEKAFSAIGATIAIVLATLALLSLAWYQGYQQQQKLNAALITTGNSAGVTADHVRDLADSLTAAGKSSADNQALLTALIGTGRTTADTFDTVGHAASNAMKITGESVDQVTSSFENLYDDPLAWADNMDKKFHFLTLDVRDHVQALIDTGDKYGAAEVAAKAFADNTDPKIKQLNESMGTLERLTKSVGDYFSRVKQFYADIGKDPTAMQSFVAAKKDYEDWQAAIKRAGLDVYDPKNNDALQYGVKLWNKMKDARDKVISQQAGAQAQAQYDAQRQAVLEAGKGIDAISDKTQKQINLQNKLNQLAADYKKLYFLDPNNKRLQGVSFDAQGNPSGGSYASKAAELKQQAFGKSKAFKGDDALIKQSLAEAQAFDQLRSTIDPTYGAILQLNKAQGIYADAVKKGVVTQDQADFELAQYQAQLFATLNPLEALTQSLDKQIEATKGTTQQRKAQQDMEKAVQELLRSGVVLTDEQTAALQKKYEVLETGLAQQKLEEKVLRAVNSATQDQIKELEQLNKLKSSGALTQDQVNQYEYQQNPDVFKGTQFGQDQQIKQLQDQADLVKELNAQKVLNEQDTATALMNIDNQQMAVRLQGAQTFFGSLSALQNTHSKKAFKIGQAAAIAQTVINTYQSATEAYASLASIPYVGPFLGAAAAAAAVAAGLANVSAIRSQQMPAYRTGGSYTVGGSGGVDSQTVAFRATPGEKISINTPAQARALERLDEDKQQRGARVVQQSVTMVVQGRMDRRTKDQLARGQRRAAQKEFERSK